MSWTFRDATRERTPLLLGLVGPSGGGKTYSAHRFATGVARVTGGKIAALDTEARRMLRYADTFKFGYSEFGAPFSSLRYLEAIQAAAQAARIVIVDSMSHEHEGPDGYLEFHEQEVTRMAGNDYAKRDRVNMLAWAKPAAARRRLINTMVQLDLDALILCFRAKEKVKPLKVRDPQTGKEKQEWVEQGWQAIAGAEFVFEMTTVCVLPPKCNGVPDWTAEASKIEEHHKAIFPAGEQITEETGEQMAVWFQGGDKKPPPAAADRRQQREADERLLRQQGSLHALGLTFQSLWRASEEDADRQAWLLAEKDKCKLALERAEKEAQT